MNGSARTGYAWVLLAVLLFSTIEVVTKAMGPVRPALQLAFLRFFLAGLVLLPLALRELHRKGRRLARQDWVLYAGLGLIGVTAGIGLYHLALARLQANQAAILFSGNPVFVVALAPALLKERVDRRQVAALALGVAGMTCFVWDRGSPSLRTAAGVMLMVASMATAAAYAAYFHGMSRVSASRASTLFFAKPVLAALLAWFLLREPLGAASLLGGALIVAATALAIRSGGGGTLENSKLQASAKM